MQYESADVADLRRRLGARGHTLGEPAVRQWDRMLLHRVDDVFIFEWDAEDIADGRCSLKDVRERNRGRIFPAARQ